MSSFINLSGVIWSYFNQIVPYLKTLLAKCFFLKLRLGSRTAIDYAHLLKELSDVHFPRARTIVLVQDNLNTHVPSSLYEAFPPDDARRIAERFEWHYTPKHGSWLNMAEAELSVLARQCLARRIPDVSTLEDQVSAWLVPRNKHHAIADWRFTTHHARIKLKNLYPVL